MRATKKSILCLALLYVTLFPVGTLSATDENVFPEQIVEKSKTLLLNGVATRLITIFRVKVYLAALYLEKRMSDEAQILKGNFLKKIDLVFLRDVEAKDIVDSWKRGFRTNCKVDCDSMHGRLEELNAKMIDVSRGQKVSLLFRQDGLEVRTPGKDPVLFPGREFADVILSTFIGEAPPTPEVKLGLLGKLTSDPKRAVSSTGSSSLRE
jgi:hypothetical protein